MILELHYHKDNFYYRLHTNYINGCESLSVGYRSVLLPFRCALYHCGRIENNYTAWVRIFYSRLISVRSVHWFSRDLYLRMMQFCFTLRHEIGGICTDVHLLLAILILIPFSLSFQLHIWFYISCWLSLLVQFILFVYFSFVFFILMIILFSFLCECPNS